MTSPPTGSADRYRGEWRHFARWCAVHNRPTLPTDTDTLADYIADQRRDAPATKRSRIAAINRRHQADGHPEPGRAEVIRQAINRRRAARLAQMVAAVDRRLPGIPCWGWPQGLFGRRDAALLILAAAGLSAPRIAALTRADVVPAAGGITVRDPPVLIPNAPDPYRCPVTTLNRWIAAHDLVAHPAGRGLLEHHLEHRTMPELGQFTVDGTVALFTSFDRRGWTPLPDPDPGTGKRPVLQALSADSVSAIVRAHLSGRASAHRRRRIDVSVDEPAIKPSEPEIVLDPGSHDAGLAARRRGTAELGDEINNLLADFDHEADQLNARLAALLDLATGTS